MKIEVLDHGYVEFVEAWGTGRVGRDSYLPPTEKVDDFEVGIIEAARQSTQGSFRGWEPAACDCGWKDDAARTAGADADHMNGHYKTCASEQAPGDKRLLKYLYRNNHSTPFEFAGMVLEVQAPIFVFREWHRHRTQSYNEASARYAPLPDLNYMPSLERLLAPSGGNKQAQGLKPLDNMDAARFRHTLLCAYDNAERQYQIGLENGVPKELARLLLPVGRYSKMRASANLRNWLAFMTLRCDPAAQWEIQQYALAVSTIIQAKFPQTHELWRNERV